MSDHDIQQTEPPKSPTPARGEGARALVTVAAAFIVLFGLKYTQDFAIPIVMAIFLAIVTYPLTAFLRRRIPHWLAVGLSVLVDFGIIFAVVCLVRYLVPKVVNGLNDKIVEQLSDKYTACLQYMDRWGDVGKQMGELMASPLSVIDTQYLISFSQSLAGRLFSFMSLTMLVLILMTFLLGEAPLFARNFDRSPHSAQRREKMIDAIKGVQRYLLIKTVASVCTGILAGCLCYVMDVPLPLLWGIVACVLNFIPTIGSIVAAIPPILLALGLEGWSCVFIVAGGYLAINFIIGNGVEPLFLGKKFGIATSVVLLSVIIWGWVWGPMGMLLAVPITMFTKLALETSNDLRWVAVLMDDKPSPADNSNIPHQP